MAIMKVTSVLLSVCVIISCLFIDDTISVRHFYHGRKKGGNLGAPHIHKRQLIVIEGVIEESKVQELYFIQKLDHFSPTNTTTWRQRYFVNDEFYQSRNKKGPIFLMIGGEGPASPHWMTAGSWIDDAKKHGALLFQMEHRYYGQSHPTPDLSIENLKFLSSEQALADLASFITSMNEEYELDNDAKWIAFGGSYSGSLSAWLRAKYPHLVYGAMSASSPLLAKLDFDEYMKVLAQSLSTHSDACVKAVKNGVAQVDILLKEKVGQQNLNEIFRLCDPIKQSLDNPDDIANLYESLADNFADIVQYNRDNRMSDNRTANITIDTVCDIMVDEARGPPVYRLGAVNSLLMNSLNTKCLDYRYSNLVKSMKETSWDSEAAEGARQWNYQTCTEFGFFQTSSDGSHVFGHQFPLDFFIKQCKDIYGVIYDKQFLESVIDGTNMDYGGLDIEVSNVVFVHGSIDPWHALGITKTISKKAPAIFIQGTAHCANMYPPSPNDLPSLVKARQEVSKLIDSWIAMNDPDHNDCYML